MKVPIYVIAFGGLLSFLAFGHLLVIYKYFLVLIHHGLYYCQEMAKTINIKLPGDIGKVIAGIVIFAALFTLFRIVKTVLGVYSLRRSLDSKSNTDTKINELLDRLGLQEEVSVYSEDKPLAFCFGIRDPKIYLSTGLIRLMNEHEIEVILRHEKYHLEHRDTLALFLASIIESLFPFFPVISDIIGSYRTHREIEADKSAINNDYDKKSLRDVLKKLIQHEPTLYPSFVPGIIGIDTLEARILSLNMTGSIRKLGIMNIVLSFISLIILLGLMVTPVNAIELHEEGRDVVLLCNGTDACETVCSKQTLQQLQSYQPQHTSSTQNNFSSAY